MATPSERIQVHLLVLELNAIPWWKPLKRQAAARRLRYTLLELALREIEEA